MLFSWLRRRRRRQVLSVAFPAQWQETLEQRLGHYSVISEKERKRLREVVQIMLDEKEWEGCRGLELTDAMRVVIAGSAAILVLGFDDFYFDNVQTILVYPNAFVVKEERALAGGATVEEESDRLGEAHARGPVILAWDEVQENALRPGYGQNLIFHEFAHQLDMLNGAFDGTPDLATNDLAQRWARVMNDEFLRLQRAERRGRETLLDPYGANNPAEFFAVATECFFDSPHAMRGVYPDLYAIFREYFRQDPAVWKEFEAWRPPMR